MSASWFLVSTHLIWIFGSKLILSNNKSSTALWVGDTCLIVGLRPLLIIMITASLSSKIVMHGFDVFRIGSARWPDGPPQSGVAQRVNLLPVSGVGEAVDGEKIGRTRDEGTFIKGMTNDGMIFEAHKQFVKPLSPNA